MAHIDAETLFSDKQALANGPSTNIVQVPSGAKGDVKSKGTAGSGTPVYLNVFASGATAGPLTVTVKTAAKNDMTGAVNAAVYTVAADVLKAGGAVLSAALPSNVQEFVRLEYAGGSGGTITAGLSVSAQTNL